MKIALIYLAAGNSKRFGKENKLLYPVGGKPMFRCLLDRLESLCGRHPEYKLCVVTRYDEIAGYGHSRGIRTVFSPNSDKGVSYTIRAGIEACSDADAFVFFTADQPYFTEETAEGFLGFMKNGGCTLGCVSSNGEGGNPVWFDKKFVPELLSLTGDTGGRRVLKAHKEECVMYEVDDPKELKDIDIREQGICSDR